MKINLTDNVKVKLAPKGLMMFTQHWVTQQQLRSLKGLPEEEFPIENGEITMPLWVFMKIFGQSANPEWHPIIESNALEIVDV